MKLARGWYKVAYDVYPALVPNHDEDGGLSDADRSATQDDSTE